MPIRRRWIPCDPLAAPSSTGSAPPRAASPRVAAPRPPCSTSRPSSVLSHSGLSRTASVRAYLCTGGVGGDGSAKRLIRGVEILVPGHLCFAPRPRTLDGIQVVRNPRYRKTFADRGDDQL